MPLHPSYICHCTVYTPKKDDFGDEMGICGVCNCVNDERLYQIRVQQHDPDWNKMGATTVHDYLREKDLHYKEITD